MGFNEQEIQVNKVNGWEKIKDKVKFSDIGLVPAIIQDAATNKVLMLAYMNEESLQLTISTGETHFYSRSRQELWHKGATSGHVQRVKKAYYDCDGDTLLFLVDQEGVACHTGAMSCFHNQFVEPKDEAADLQETGRGDKRDGSLIGGVATRNVGDKQVEDDLGNILEQVFRVIKSRQEELPEGSYTTYLFQKGQDKILKKVAEEAGEVLIGSKNNNNSEVVYEASDLIYHLMVLLAYHGLTLSDIGRELAKRR